MPGGSITGNNLVWKKLNFSAITTAKIRVVVNGAVDPTFGTAGAVVTSFGRFKVSGNAVSLQADGRILIAGTTGVTNVDTANDFTIARFWP